MSHEFAAFPPDSEPPQMQTAAPEQPAETAETIDYDQQAHAARGNAHRLQLKMWQLEETGQTVPANLQASFDFYVNNAEAAQRIHNQQKDAAQKELRRQKRHDRWSIMMADMDLQFRQVLSRIIGR